MNETVVNPSTNPSSQPSPSKPQEATETDSTEASHASSMELSGVFLFHRTDAGNAELFSALFGHKLRYDHATQRWLIFEEHWWVPDSDSQVLRLAKSAARWRCRAAYHLIDMEKEGDDLKEAEKQAKWAISSEGKYRLEAALKLAQSERPLADSGQEWNRDPLLFGVANGMVDLRTGNVRPGKPSDRVTLHTDIPVNAMARCPGWMKFLHEIFAGDQELIDFVQRAVGYCMTGEVNEQVLFMCYGTGANGKSTFLEVIRHVLGDYAYNLPFSAFELKARSNIPNEIAALSSKRFVTAIETNENVELNEGRIKALTGSDPITARFLYKEFFTFDPTGKFWLAVNHKPRVSDDSPGFWRRVRLIPFTQQFPEGKRDPELLDKLKAEGQGILNWAVEGALRWQAEGLNAPKVVIQASKRYQRESDVLADFLEERCEVAPSAQVTAASMWAAYRAWAEANRERPLDRKSFAQRLDSRGFRKDRVGHNRTWTWIGLSLKPDPIPSTVPASSPVRADADVKKPLLPN